MDRAGGRGVRERTAAALLVILALGVGDRTAVAADARPLSESTGVTLTLLDVEVRDKDGRPVRGLGKDDFRVRLDGREWPLYSVDDLCACADDPARDRATRDGPSGPGLAPQDTPPTAHPGASADRTVGRADEPLRYVLFIDFGGLQVSGRALAFREARRWIREVKQPGDEVMIAGYTQQRGLVEACPFSVDPGRLLGALAEAEADPKLQDSFPSGIESRVNDCQEDTARCLSMCQSGGGDCDICFPTHYCSQIARDEYMHGRDSLLALKDLLVGLEAIPGRKALLHFQQNGTVFPGRIYNDRKRSTDDHVKLMDAIGAEANLARTAIHGAYTGDWLGADKVYEKELAHQAVTLASNLADATGGTYGRDLNALKGLTTAVRSDCSCTYRLGLEPPGKPGDAVHSARVEVRGEPLPHAYRVVFLDETGRWLRQALAVLRNPESASRIPIGAALVPVRSSENGVWDVRIQIAFDVDALAMVLERDARRGSWEAGALLASDGGTQPHWELMSISSMRRSPSGEASPPTRRAVMHERVLKGVPPGRLTLRAFVRDRTALVLGGASAVLDLPRPGHDALSGPVLVSPGRRHLLATLPFFTKQESAESRVMQARTGEIPAPSTVRAGEPVEAVTWICPRRASRREKAAAARESKAPLEAALTRELAREGGAASSLQGPAEITPVGSCHRFSESLATATLAPGSYTYTVRWKTRSSGKPRTAAASFTVEAPVKSDAPAQIGSTTRRIGNSEPEAGSAIQPHASAPSSLRASHR